MNESKLVNGVDIRNGLDESGLQSPERTLLPPPPVNSPATAIPGWFNVAGNGDGWAAASTTNSANNATSADDGKHSSSSDADSLSSTARSGAVPMQNGTKRLKTHHVGPVFEGGDSEAVTTTTATAPTTTPATSSGEEVAAAAADEDNGEEASSDSVSSEASEASCKLRCF